MRLDEDLRIDAMRRHLKQLSPIKKIDSCFDHLDQQGHPRPFSETFQDFLEDEGHQDTA